MKENGREQGLLRINSQRSGQEDHQRAGQG